MPRFLQSASAAVCCGVPTLAMASGDMSGVYAAFVAMPLVAIVSFIVVVANLQRNWKTRTLVAVAFVPIAVIACEIIDLVFRHTFIQDHPASAMWPNVVGAVVAIALVGAAVGYLNRASEKQRNDAGA
jgi:hypothetical protein